MTTDKQNLDSRVQRTRRLLSTTLLAMLLLLSGGCSLNHDPEGDLVFEPTLPPVGLIFEYDISPDGQYAALLMPTEAAEPGSDAYLRIIQTSVWGKQQILVFNLATGEAVSRSPATRDDIVHLRWLTDGAELLYLTWSTDGNGSEPELVRWNILTGTMTKRPFPHIGFDLADDGSLLAAWGADHLAIESNEVEVYNFPSLQKIASFTIPAQDIRSLDWASDNSWLLVDTGPELLRLELVDGSAEKLVDAVEANGFSSPLLGPTNRFLLGQDVGVTLFDLRQVCIILSLEADGPRNEYRAAHWSNKPGQIYILFRENEKAQQTIQKVDISRLLDDDPLRCLSGN